MPRESAPPPQRDWLLRGVLSHLSAAGSVDAGENGAPPSQCTPGVVVRWQDSRASAVGGSARGLAVLTSGPVVERVWGVASECVR